MIHKMKLQPKYFDFIKNGTKRIELRLNDKKRRLVQIGDSIIFSKKPNGIEELFQDFDISILADSSITKEQLLDIIQTIYSLEEQKKTRSSWYKN